jgi:DNA-binding transcriptional ArsR family regulator
MVNYSAALLDATFGALADPTRRAILARLAKGETSVTALAQPFAMSLPAVSKHLRVLESAGLVRREIDGRVHRCRLAPEPMQSAAAWIEQYRGFWERQFDSLASFLENSSQKEPPSWPQANQRNPNISSRSAESSPRPAKKSSPRGRKSPL